MKRVELTSKRLVIAAIPLMMLPAVLLLLRPDRASQATINGRPVTEWLAKLDPPMIGDQREDLAALGYQFLPYLVQKMDLPGKHPSPYAWIWSRLPAPARQHLPLPHRYQWDELNVRINAMLVFEDILDRLDRGSPDAMSAAPVLESLLGAEGPVAGQYPLVRRLWLLTKRPEKVLPFLQRNLAGYTARGDRRLLQMAADIGPSAASLVPQIIPLLATQDHLVKVAAAQALGAIGPPAHSAIPALKVVANSPNEFLKLQAREALKRIEPNSPPDQSAKHGAE